MARIRRSGGRSSSRSRSVGKSGRTTARVSRVRSRVKRTTSRPARKASKRTAKASRRQTAVTIGRNYTVRTNTKGTRNTAQPRPTTRTGLKYLRSPLLRAKSPRVRFSNNRIPRIQRLSKVWKRPQAVKQLSTRQQVVRCRPPNKIKRRIPLFEGYQQKNNPIGFNQNNQMLAGESRYLPPADTEIFPRKIYSAFGDSPVNDQVLNGQREAGFNFEQALDKFMQSGLLIPIGAGLAGLIVLKVIMR